MTTGPQTATCVLHPRAARWPSPLLLVVLLAAPFLTAPGAVVAQADHRADRALEATQPMPHRPLSEADHAFLHYAIDHGRMSGQANELARERAAWPALRRLADTMLAEQRALTGSLLALVGPDSPSAATRIDHNRDLRALVEADRATFDREFLRLLLINQREAVSRYRTAAEDPALSEAVREFARDALPLVELHLELARDTDRMLAELD
jgi:predicted outer membrane protein